MPYGFVLPSELACRSAAGRVGLPGLAVVREDTSQPGGNCSAMVELGYVTGGQVDCWAEHLRRLRLFRRPGNEMRPGQVLPVEVAQVDRDGRRRGG